MAMIATTEFTFDAERHEYRVNGALYPSVTQVIRAAGLVDERYYTPESAALGQHVHATTALDDQGVLDEVSLDDRLRPYLAAWRRFRQLSGVTIQFIEWRGWSPYGFAGAVDRLATWKARTWVLDIKTGAPQPWHALQTAAYVLLFGGKEHPRQRACVYLRDDGAFRFAEHSNHSDVDVFRAALLLHQWKERHDVRRDCPARPTDDGDATGSCGLDGTG
jgi:hypothetical protein